MQRFDLPLADPSAAAALASAARSAKRYLISRRTFRASVTGHAVVAETYDRVLYNIERRQLDIRSVAGGSGSLRSFPTPSGVDPWGVNPDTVEHDTRVVTACPPCHGAGDVACPTCKGSTYARCPSCVGGKVFAQRKGRWFKNCPHCRGRGTQKCTVCRGGRVSCQGCNASGRVTAWLILERKLRFQVTVHPRNAAARVHQRIAVLEDFDSGVWPARLSADSGVQSSLRIPDELAPILAHTERVTGARRQTFCTDVHKFTFTTPVGDGRVEVAGEPPVVSPSSRWTGLRTRLVLAAMLALVGMVGVVTLGDDYVARHAWYAQYGDLVPLLVFGASASLLFGVALAMLLITRAARSWFAIAVSIAAAAAFGLGVVLAYTYNQPSLATARRELAAGNLTRAQDEAQALVDLHRDAASSEVLLDDLHLHRAKETRSYAALTACVRESWRTVRARREAEAVLRSRTEDAATRMYANHDVDGLSRLSNELGETLPDVTEGIRWLVAVIRVGVVLELADVAATRSQLDSVVRLAERVPQAMRPTEAAQIAVAATRLDRMLAATATKSPRDRVRLLAAALDAASDYARLIGMEPSVATRGLVRQQETARALARAQYQAQQKARRDRAALAQQPADPPAGDPIDPYTLPTETAPAPSRNQ